MLFLIYFTGELKLNVETLDVVTYICNEMKIEEAIQQKKFESEFQKAHINILFTANWLSQSLGPALEPLNLTWQQFNILRILRGMHPEPASVKVLTERMIDKMSNASRLVEKLKQKGMVERKACPADRRQVDIVLTDKGQEILEVASNGIAQMTQDTFASLTEEEGQTLNRLLDKIRSAC